jgi:Pyruvate/2-oxoacid:ferredoxin oxidoreductase delta subunit
MLAHVICTGNNHSRSVPPLSHSNKYSHRANNTSISTVPRKAHRTTRRWVIQRIDIVIARAKRSSCRVPIVICPSRNVDERVAEQVGNPSLGCGCEVVLGNDCYGSVAEHAPCESAGREREDGEEERRGAHSGRLLSQRRAGGSEIIC